MGFVYSALASAALAVLLALLSAALAALAALLALASAACQLAFYRLLLLILNTYLPVNYRIARCQIIYISCNYSN